MILTRAFIALDLSKDTKDQLAILQQTLRECRARLTFVDPDLIHITVKFLGEVDDKKLRAVMDALAKVPFIPYPVTTGIVMVNNKNRPHNPIYITPLIMGATMVIQQKMTPTSADPTQAKMFMLMPIMFTFLFLSFPSGLVLYWLINNVLSIAHQYYVNKK